MRQQSVSPMFGAKEAPDPPANDHQPVRGTVDYRALPPSARRIWHLENAVAFLIATVIPLTAFHAPFTPDGWRVWQLPVLAAIVAGTLIEALLVIPRRFASYRYALTEECLVVVRGRVFVRERIFPLARILYVESRQGPLLRRYGLFRMHVGTLAEPHVLGPVPASVVLEVRRAVEAR